MLYRKILNYLIWQFWEYAYLPYHLYANYRSTKIRQKENIRVLFVVAELGAWKTEPLYLKMVDHKRFTPIIGLTTSLEVPGSKEPFRKYLQKKQYEYVDLDESKSSISDIHPDIIFYYKPYDDSYPKGICFKYHLRSLICSLHYAFNQGKERWAYSHHIYKWSWQCYVENALVEKVRLSISGLYHGNIQITGFPIQDYLMQPPKNFENPWKNDDNRKRIIYAPHHSIKGTNPGGVEYSTFFEFHEVMINLAKKYRNKIQVAFKPHPTLYPKLIRIWGKKKTDDYYMEWQQMENTQVELGDYIGLFKYSDAMIHDCSSFCVEYLYMKKPALYLISNGHHNDHQNEFGCEAYNVHEHAMNAIQIEEFINNVIKENDKNREIRDNFYANYLVPPARKNASENIIDAILGITH